MLQFTMDFPKGFSSLYNRIASTKKGKKYLKIEGIDRERLNLPLQSKEYFTKENIADMSVDANANANGKNNLNYNNYLSEIAKGQLKLQGYYLLHRELERMYSLERADDLLTKIIQGDLYFHDSTAIQLLYCFATTTSKIMMEGRSWGQLKSSPPKRLRSFMSQIVETAMDMSQEQAGALAIGDLIVNASYYTKQKEPFIVTKDGEFHFIEEDFGEIGIVNDDEKFISEDNILVRGKKRLTNKEIENEFQNFVHIMNNTFRVSGQSPFTNISMFCRNNIKALFDGYYFPDGSQPDIEEVMRLQEIFMKFFTKGDPKTGEPYTFPVVTSALLEDNITKDENGNLKYPLDELFEDMVAEYNFRTGAMNEYGSDDVGKIASCCRLVNDLKLKGGDSFGNGGLNIGSHRVVTLNLPRIALYAKDRYLSNKQFFNLLESYMEDARDLLKAHRKLLHKRAKKGFLKFIEPLGFIDIDRHLFSTVGINGMFEMMYFLNDGEVLDGKKIKKSIIKREKKIISFINHKTKEWAKEDNLPYNVEQVPAESLAPKNAQKDKVMFGDDIIPFDLYSNQFIPSWMNYDIFDRIKLEGEFFEELSGGGITHLNFNAPLQSKEDYKKISRFARRNGSCHFAVNYFFNKCSQHHTTIGSNKETICPICGEEIQKRKTRIIGYFTDIDAWSAPRKKDYFNRAAKTFNGGN